MEVFDIFGAVRCPSYSIRFNSEKEARENASEGINVFVAETDEYTKKILTDKLKKWDSITIMITTGKNWMKWGLCSEKHVDGVLVLNERGEEEEIFSDDEMEQQAARNC